MSGEIFIPFGKHTSVGGPATFMKNLKKALDECGYRYARSPGGARGIFFPIAYRRETLRKFKERNRPVIQRLDGVYYPSKHGDGYAELNEKIRDIYLNYSDFIVFQSEYSKQQCFAMFGEKDRREYAVIVNGVDADVFYPAVDKRETRPETIKFLTTGSFRNEDMLAPIVLALDSLVGEFNFSLTIAGPVINESLGQYLERDYIDYVGVRNPEEVARLLRESDMFLFSSLNPPCPNSVLEAIATGIPVVGFEDGALPELLPFSKNLLAYVSDDVFKKAEDLRPEKLAEKIRYAEANYESCRRKALEHCNQYSMQKCARRYTAVFEKCLAMTPAGRSSSPGIGRRLLAKIACLLFSVIPGGRRTAAKMLRTFLERYSDRLKPAEALRFLFDVDAQIYGLLGKQSIRYGGGVHTKHRHIGYHNFFISNIEPASRILDIGCGNGALAFDIASGVRDVRICAVDILETNIVGAKKHFAAENIEYVCGEAPAATPEGEFDVIVLSNVLEHIERRVEFLQTLSQKHRPKKYLIRVPMFERDWTVPLKKELGLDYRLDATHYVEYRQEDFRKEMDDAGLQVEHCDIRWGEIWAVASGTIRGGI